MIEHEKHTMYTEEQKRLGVSCYLASGSYEKAERLCGIKWQTIAQWKNRTPDWWDETVASLNAEMEEQYRAGWRGVLSKSLDVMQDRLENGNHMPVKVKKEDGSSGYEMVRVPVPAKDAVVIGGIAADKLRVSMGLPNRITGKVEDNDRLEELRKLAEASRAARKEAEKDSTGQTIN